MCRFNGPTKQRGALGAVNYRCALVDSELCSVTRSLVSLPESGQLSRSFIRSYLLLTIRQTSTQLDESIQCVYRRGVRQRRSQTFECGGQTPTPKASDTRRDGGGVECGRFGVDSE